MNCLAAAEYLVGATGHGMFVCSPTFAELCRLPTASGWGVLPFR